ncbi:BQ5605_C010g06193 [Microbotryum silenes-dioicae]|uniref:BQ5605_C010g06193 protein n=1 Tax=Microbotryum silenes-dioicae TaxID=796604 RepID=A0A2X0LQV8_9BASI|nr:BQ5605_C010g06193 [Microbotryum silenes-dioicae]
MTKFCFFEPLPASPLADKNVETKRQWYTITLKNCYSARVLDGEKIQLPKFVYDVNG